MTEQINENKERMAELLKDRKILIRRLDEVTALYNMYDNTNKRLEEEEEEEAKSEEVESTES